MRRIVCFVLLGLGVFAVALGLLLRLNVYPRLAKIPLDVDKTVVAQGSDITALLVLSENGAPKPEIRRGLDLTVTRHITADLTQPEVTKDGDVAVYVEAIRGIDDESNVVVTGSVREVCLDRHTNEAVVPCEAHYYEETRGQRVTGDRNQVQQPGLSFKFPFATEQRSYQMYDLKVKTPVEARFDGEENINGLDVYRFVMEVPATDIGDQEVPGSLIGEDEAVVDADLFYQVKRTVWVEPVTGQIVKGQDQIKQELVRQGDSPGEGTAVFDGTLTFNEKTVNDNVTETTENKSKLWLLTTFPIILWISGGVLIVAALVLLLVWRPGRGGVAERPSPPQQQFAGAARG